MNLTTEFEKKYNELAATIKEAQEKIQKESQALVENLFKDFFARHGKHVYAIHWTQYTPYFNDGEECTFSVHDMYLSFTEGGYEDGEGDADLFSREDTYREHLAKWEAYEADPRGVYQKYVDGYSNRWGSPDPFERWKPSYFEKQELLDKIEVIETRSDLQNIVAEFDVLSRVVGGIDDDYMKMIYGNHAKVTYFGPDGTLDVDEYDHD